MAKSVGGWVDGKRSISSISPLSRHLAQPREGGLVLRGERRVHVDEDVLVVRVRVKRAHDEHEHALEVDRPRRQVAWDREDTMGWDGCGWTGGMDQCTRTRGAHVVHMRCTCGAHAAHAHCTCNAHAMHGPAQKRKTARPRASTPAR